MSHRIIRILDKIFPDVISDIIMKLNEPVNFDLNNEIKIYEIFEYGGVLYRVVVNGKIAIIFDASGELLFCYEALNIFPGIDPLEQKYNGNTVILQMTENQFIFIGFSIYEFEIEDNVVNYYSPLRNNNTPYPILQGTKNFYFMLTYNYNKIKDFNGHINTAYDEYYQGLEKTSKKIKNVKYIHIT